MNIGLADKRGIASFDSSSDSSLEGKIKYECRTQNMILGELKALLIRFEFKNLEEIDFFNKQNTQRLIDELKFVQEVKKKLQNI